MKDKKLVQVQKKSYSEPKIQNIGRMIIHTNGTTSRTNDPGGSLGGDPNANAGPKK